MAFPPEFLCILSLATTDLIFAARERACEGEKASRGTKWAVPSETLDLHFFFFVVVGVVGVAAKEKREKKTRADKMKGTREF